MLRHEPTPERATVSDLELGVAAVLLLFTIFLTAIFVPALG